MEATRHSLFHPAAFRKGVLSDPPDIPSAHTPPQSPPQQQPQPHIPNASSLPAAAPAPAAALWRAFPAVPYYAPARGLQLRVELRDGRDAAALQSLLHRAASRHGVLHIFSPAPKRSAPPSVPPSVPPTAPTAPLFDPLEYVTALHDGFARLSALRERCQRREPPRTTHHALYVRIRGDAQLKDVSALLAVEGGRLCLCLCASSRVTQEHLSQRTLAVGAPLEWSLGAALVEEPLAVDHRAALCPVAAAWDAVANLSPRGDAEVAVAASFPFAGATRHSPALRLTEMCGAAGAGRALWTLAGPSPRAVLPQLVAAIVRALVEHGGVDGFELRLLHDESDAAANGSGSGAIATAATAAAQWGRRGVAFVGAARDGAVVRSGPTNAASPLAFSRMSSRQWLSEEDCIRSGLIPQGGAHGGEEVEPLECEFALDALRYARRKGVSGDGRDETERGGGVEGEEGEKEEEKEEEEEEEEGEDDGDLFDTQRWGECFQMRLHVERIIDEEDTE